MCSVRLYNLLTCCFFRIEAKYPKIGGYGTIVECDETAFHVNKYHRGTKTAETAWILGGWQTYSIKMQLLKEGSVDRTFVSLYGSKTNLERL